MAKLQSKPRTQAADAASPQLTARGRLTRNKLLEGAASAFSQMGFERTRVADIVRLAGVSHGNFYRHFADKDAILLAVLVGLYESLRTSTGRNSESVENMPTLEALERRNCRFFRDYARNRELLRVALEAAARVEANTFLDLWLDMRGIFIRRNARWLTDLQARGVLDENVSAQRLAEALGSMTEQMAYVQVGLAPVCTSNEELDELGRTAAHIWYGAIFGRAR